MAVSIATTRVACNTSDGDQDITITSFGTPKAALFLATRAVTDGTAANGAGFYIAATDGTNHWGQAYEDEHAAASSDSQSSVNAPGAGEDMLVIKDGTADSATEGYADFSTWITDGVRINWGNAPVSAFLLNASLFGGSDLSAAAGITGLGNTTDLATDITAVGFEADVVICVLAGDIANGEVSIGFIHNDRAGTVTQRVASIRSRSARLTMEMMGMMRNDACIMQQGNTAVDWWGEASTFDSSGFTITTRNAGANNLSIAWLALRFGASPVVSSKVYTFSTPTGTGDNTDTGLGAEPQAVFYVPCLHEAANTFDASGLSGSLGLSVITAAAQYCTTNSSEDNAADSNTQSLSDNQAVNLPLHDGSAGLAAAYSTFTSSGVTLSWSDVESAAKLWPALAIGSGAAPPAGDILRQMMVHHGG